MPREELAARPVGRGGRRRSMKWLGHPESRAPRAGRNKLRSVLTMLGIIIGVGAVIAMVSIGQGAEVHGPGADREHRHATSCIVTSGQPQHRRRPSRLRRAPDPDRRGRRGHRAGMPGRAARLAECSASEQVVYGNQNWSTRIRAPTRMSRRFANWPLEEGELLHDGDVRAPAAWSCWARPWSTTCCRGSIPSARPSASRNLPFRVVGVLAPKGQSMMGQDQDDLAVMPVHDRA